MVSSLLWAVPGAAPLLVTTSWALCSAADPPFLSPFLISCKELNSEFRMLGPLIYTLQFCRTFTFPRTRTFFFCPCERGTCLIGEERQVHLFSDMTRGAPGVSGPPTYFLVLCPLLIHTPTMSVCLSFISRAHPNFHTHPCTSTKIKTNDKGINGYCGLVVWETVF